MLLEPLNQVPPYMSMQCGLVVGDRMHLHVVGAYQHTDGRTAIYTYSQPYTQTYRRPDNQLAGNTNTASYYIVFTEYLWRSMPGLSNLLRAVNTHYYANHGNVHPVQEAQHQCPCQAHNIAKASEHPLKAYGHTEGHVFNIMIIHTCTCCAIYMTWYNVYHTQRCTPICCYYKKTCIGACMMRVCLYTCHMYTFAYMHVVYTCVTCDAYTSGTCMLHSVAFQQALPIQCHPCRFSPSLIGNRDPVVSIQCLCQQQRVILQPVVRTAFVVFGTVWRNIISTHRCSNRMWYNICKISVWIQQHS